MKILVSSTGELWSFGPYLDQCYRLSQLYLDSGAEVHYVCYKQVVNTPVTGLKFLDLLGRSECKTLQPDRKREVLSRITYHQLGPYNGYPHGSIAGINEIIQKHDIEVVVMLGDIFELLADQPFGCFSVMWYPNHYHPLDRANKLKLCYFDHIAALSPSSRDTVALGLTGRQDSPRVSYIPHIIDSRGSQLWTREQQLAAIQQHNSNNYPVIPRKAFVVTILAGNYETNYRKSFDTSFMAFNKMLASVPHAFLYVQSFTHPELRFITDLSLLAEEVGIPSDKIFINQTRVDSVEHVYSLSNLMLVASKTEGFGLPLLEAQLRGIPVVTSRFLAMGDFCFLGESAIPLQQHYDHFGGGMATIPDVTMLGRKMVQIYHEYDTYLKRSPETRAMIEREFSQKRVKQLFDDVISSRGKTRLLRDTFDHFDHCFIVLGQPQPRLVESLGETGNTILICTEKPDCNPKSSLKITTVKTVRDLAVYCRRFYADYVHYLDANAIVSTRYFKELTREQGKANFNFLLTKTHAGQMFPNSNCSLEAILTNTQYANFTVGCFLNMYVLDHLKQSLLLDKVTILTKILELGTPTLITQHLVVSGWVKGGCGTASMVRSAPKSATSKTSGLASGRLVPDSRLSDEEL